MDWNRIQEHGKLWGKKPRKPMYQKRIKIKISGKIYRNQFFTFYDRNKYPDLIKRLRQFQSKNRAKQTPGERRMKKILKKINVRFEYQKICVVAIDGKPKGFLLDFFLPDFKAAFEIDGSQHLIQGIMDKDRERSNLIRKQHGIEICRFQNSDTKFAPECAKKAQNFLKKLIVKSKA